MIRVMVGILLAIGIGAAASAQTYRAQRDQMFCQIQAEDVALALGDYAIGTPMQTSLKRADDFVCYTSEVAAQCDARKSMIRRMIATAYTRLGPAYGLKNAPAAELAKAQAEARIRTNSMCVDAARR